jgi:DNA-binding transcriptional regulator GbsR (MarR family)
LIKKHDTVAESRERLIDVGGKTSQDLGMGRIVGQILMYLYLYEGERSLDQVSEDLGVSKAAVSVAVRQLESLGMVRRLWIKGDRKKYYKSADNIAAAIRQGLLSFLGQKMQSVTAELDHIDQQLGSAVIADGDDPETNFVYGRVKRAKQLGDRAAGMLKNPIVDFFVKS